MTTYEQSEAWLRGFCFNADCPDYDRLIELLREAHENGGYYSWGGEDGYPDYYNINWGADYLHFGGTDAHGRIPPEFWKHVAVILGIDELPLDRKPSYFSCSC